MGIGRGIWRLGGAAALIAGAAHAATGLASGAGLGPGQSLDNAGHRLVMQADCNLVLYRGAAPLWSSRTEGKGAGCSAVMQPDGNLVVVTGANQPVWGAMTHGNSGARAELSAGGVLTVIQGRRVLWASDGIETGTRGQASGAGRGQGRYGAGYNGGRRGQDDLTPGDWLDGRRNEQLMSRNGQFALRMQGDCNLVLYARERAIWDSRTRGAGRDCRAVFDNDGRLVVEADRRVVWNSNSASRGPRPQLILQDDGNLVAYDGNRPYWATNTDRRR